MVSESSIIVGWRIYYADGTTTDSKWDAGPAPRVVANVVFEGDRETATRGGPIIESYRKLYYEDEGDAEALGFPQYRFWRTAAGEFGAGYETPPRGSIVKLGAGVADPFEAQFTALGRHKRWMPDVS